VKLRPLNTVRDWAGEAAPSQHRSGLGG